MASARYAATPLRSSAATARWVPMHGVCMACAWCMHGVCTVYAWCMHGVQSRGEVLDLDAAAEERSGTRSIASPHGEKRWAEDGTHLHGKSREG